MTSALSVIVGLPLFLLWLASVFSVLCAAFSREPWRPATIDELVARCRAVGGWELVLLAQREVHAAMPDDGYCNGFDTPPMALARGRGACWQRALVLRAVLRACGIETRVVHAFLTRFESGLVLGHAWLEVEYQGSVKRVCPGRSANTPGVVDFEPLTRVRTFGVAALVLSWLGSPIASMFAALTVRLRGGRVRPRAGVAVGTRTRLTHSGVWLLLPILGWNVALAPRLPGFFSDDRGVPGALLIAEALGRVFVFAMPIVLTVGFRHRWQRRGLALFSVGTFGYLLSWLPILLGWPPSWLWVLPYVLPIGWLLGLGLMARSGGYLVGSTLFALAHAAHGVIVVAAQVVVLSPWWRW